MGMRIEFDVKLFVKPSDIDRSRRVLLGMMHSLVYANILWIRDYPTPTIYTSGVVYKRESTEIWQDIPSILQKGYGDCEDLACWRAAELNAIGIKARPYIKWRESGPMTSQFHAVVRWPDGRIEDPSAALGMNGLPIIRQPVFVPAGPMPADGGFG